MQLACGEGELTEAASRHIGQISRQTLTIISSGIQKYHLIVDSKKYLVTITILLLSFVLGGTTSSEFWDSGCHAQAPS